VTSPASRPVHLLHNPSPTAGIRTARSANDPGQGHEVQVAVSRSLVTSIGSGSRLSTTCSYRKAIGFARAPIPPFSCKGRGVSPSCGAKRAAIFSELLQNRILADVRHAQGCSPFPKGVDAVDVWRLGDFDKDLLLPRPSTLSRSTRLWLVGGVGHAYPFVAAPDVFFRGVARFLRGDWPTNAKSIARQ
jgi:hypothetical protein